MTEEGIELRHALALDNARMMLLLLDQKGPLDEREWLQVVQLAQAAAQFARHEHLEAIRARMPGVFEIPFRGERHEGVEHARDGVLEAVICIVLMVLYAMFAILVGPAT